MKGQLRKELRDAIESQITFDNVDKDFKQNKRGSLDLSIRGLSFKNPILKSVSQSSIVSNVSRQIPKNKIEELYSLWKEREKGKRAEEKFEEEFREVVRETVFKSLTDKLSSVDLPTPVSPTSVALSEIPNYYITEPKECYAITTKNKLFNKLISTICGRCGERTYGLYVPEEGFEIKEILKAYVSDFYNINIGRIAEVGRINIREIKQFEYLFYLLDRVLQEMYRRNKVPDFHVELFVVEGAGGGGKKFFSHYIIPSLNEIFYKLYHGDGKYSSWGTSKIKALISSFLVENWEIDNKLKKDNLERAHAQINRFLYYLFCHKKLDMDSIIFLEDLKIKLGDTTQIYFLDEVISWM